MIMYQVPDTRFDQISGHKHDIGLCENLSTKLLAQAANKYAEFMFTKAGRLIFFVRMVSEATFRKNSKQTCP